LKFKFKFCKSFIYNIYSKYTKNTNKLGRVQKTNSQNSNIPAAKKVYTTNQVF